jgi:hypothetical protein
VRREGSAVLAFEPFHRILISRPLGGSDNFFLVQILPFKRM